MLRESAAKNVIRIISVLNAYYGDNAYCVRIKAVLDAFARWRSLKLKKTHDSRLAIIPAIKYTATIK